MLVRPLVLAAALTLASTTLAASAGDLDSALRPQSATISRWLGLAMERSATVRDLVSRIERADMIVYLEIQPALEPGLTACVTWMAATPTRRLVRVSLRPGLRPADAVATVAHELQHVVEVAEHPEVRSSDALLALYRRIGHSTSGARRHFDTAAAVAAGASARAEALAALSAIDGVTSA